MRANSPSWAGTCCHQTDDGPFNGFTTPMVDLGTYIFKDLNTGKITPEESFTNAYVE